MFKDFRVQMIGTPIDAVAVSDVESTVEVPSWVKCECVYFMSTTNSLACLSKNYLTTSNNNWTTSNSNNSNDFNSYNNNNNNNNLPASLRKWKLQTQILVYCRPIDDLQVIPYAHY